MYTKIQHQLFHKKHRHIHIASAIAMIFVAMKVLLGHLFLAGFGAIGGVWYTQQYENSMANGTCQIIGPVPCSNSKSCDAHGMTYSGTIGECSVECCIGTREICGNGIMEGGESCDNGLGNNDVIADSCRSDCKNSSCGDGVRDSGEQCDDGNGIGGDGCGSSCNREGCGNGIIDGAEQCDDANMTNTDSCANNCMINQISSGSCNVAAYFSIFDIDDGYFLLYQNQNLRTSLNPLWNGYSTGAVYIGDISATPPVITIQAYNANNVSIGIANNTLVNASGLEYIYIDSLNHIFPGECSPSNTGSQRSDCYYKVMMDVTLGNGQLLEYVYTGNLGPATMYDFFHYSFQGCNVSSICGNGFIEGIEQCDDANMLNADGCSSGCLLEICGNGILEGTEQCDDGNTSNYDSCTNFCESPHCGDGFIQGVEECDDGNIIHTDSCTNNCLLASCGDGFIQGTEQCDDGNAIATDSCSNACRIPNCGDSICSLTETCSSCVIDCGACASGSTSASTSGGGPSLSGGGTIPNNIPVVPVEPTYPQIDLPQDKKNLELGKSQEKTNLLILESYEDKSFPKQEKVPLDILHEYLSQKASEIPPKKQKNLPLLINHPSAPISSSRKEKPTLKETTKLDLSSLRSIFLCQNNDYALHSLSLCSKDLPQGSCSLFYKTEEQTYSLDTTNIDTCLPQVNHFIQTESYVPGSLYIEKRNNEIKNKIKFLQQFIPSLTIWGEDIFAPYIDGVARISFDSNIDNKYIFGLLQYLGVDQSTLFPQNPSGVVRFQIASNEKTENEMLSKFIKQKYNQSLVRESYNDPLLEKQEYLQTIHYADAFQICEKTTQKKVKVAVVDSAFDMNHEDFGSNIVRTKDIANKDDGVGAPLGQENNKERAHGTYSVGIIAAIPGNKKGIMSISGKASDVSLYKAADDAGRGHDIAFGIESIIAAAKEKPDIISLSWGAYINDSKTIEYIKKILSKILNQGTIVIASAGNYNKENPFYPAAIDGVIAVGAVNNSDEKAVFSNYGSWVDIAAPGVSIMTTSPLHHYEKVNGTSESAPVVTAALAWIMSKGGTWYDVATNLTPLTTLEVGRGVINLEKACLSLSKTIDQSRDPKIEEHSVANDIEVLDDVIDTQTHKYNRIGIIILSIGIIVLIIIIRSIVKYREERRLKN